MVFQKLILYLYTFKKLIQNTNIMKTKLLFLLGVLLFTQTAFGGSPFYYEVISNSDKSIDYSIGFYQTLYTISEASDNKAYVAYSGSVINNSTYSLKWETYHMAVLLKNGDLVFNYVTAAESGEYDCTFSVAYNETRYTKFCFHTVFKPEEIQDVYLINKSTMKAFKLVYSSGTTDNTTSESSTSSYSSSGNCNFFPVYGITLGKTTADELSRMGRRATNIDKSVNEPYKYYIINNVNFWYDETSLASHMYITHNDPLPADWVTCGFDWKLSYNEWLSLLRNKGFEVTITSEPQSKLYDNRQTLSAKIKAVKQITSNISVKFEFSFDYGQGSTVNSKETLYNIFIIKI